MTDNTKDPTARILLATIAAAAAPTGVFTAIGLVVNLFSRHGLIQYGNVFTVGIVFLVALAHAVLLGLPAFFVLRSTKYTQWWVAAIGGFLIGALPFFILGLLTNLSMQSDTDFSDAQSVNVFHGIKISNYMVGQIKGPIISGAFGISGGLAFWAIWRRGEARAP